MALIKISDDLCINPFQVVELQKRNVDGFTRIIYNNKGPSGTQIFTTVPIEMNRLQAILNGEIKYDAT